jgi:hypothetical protein
MLFCNPWNERKRSSSSSSFVSQDDHQLGMEEHDDDSYYYYHHQHHPTSKFSTKSSSSSSSSMNLQETLRRDFILVKLQQLVDSKTSSDAECILKEMQEAVAELIPIPSSSSPQPHEENVPLMNLLLDLQAVGTIAMIHAVLNRNDGVGRPSPMAAAPFLYEFARHGMIGFHPCNPSSSNDDEEETKESYPSPPPPSLQKCL